MGKNNRYNGNYHTNKGAFTLLWVLISVPLAGYGIYGIYKWFPRIISDEWANGIVGTLFGIVFCIPLLWPAIKKIRNKKHVAENNLDYQKFSNMETTINSCEYHSPDFSLPSMLSYTEALGDPMLMDAARLAFKEGGLSVGGVQRILGIEKERASRIIRQLEAMNILSKGPELSLRKVTMSKEEWTEKMEIVNAELESSLKPTPNLSFSPKVDKVSDIDGMDGHQFEYFVAELLEKLSYKNVEVTKGSGDQGVDVLAEKDGITYAIQCKNYTHPLGNTPVQEVAAGRDFYERHVGVVVTNNVFTTGAKELANKTRILLWDRTVLNQMIEDAQKASEEEK